MGSYLNPGGGLFRACRRSKIYVDKSNLITKTNEVLGTEQRFVCVSRPRRFGKSMAANMLAAYYGRDENAENLFVDLKISADPDFRTHLNQYDVIRICATASWLPPPSHTTMRQMCSPSSMRPGLRKTPW